MVGTANISGQEKLNKIAQISEILREAFYQ